MPTSECAFAYDQCRAARPAQSVADPAFLASLGVDEPWTSRTYRCSHCGGHWSPENDGTKRRRGYVENGEWNPVKS